MQDWAERVAVLVLISIRDNPDGIPDFDLIADPFGVVGLIGEQEAVGQQFVEEGIRSRRIVIPSRAEYEANQQTLSLDNGMDRSDQFAPEATLATMSIPLSCSRRVLMDSHVGVVDHDHVANVCRDDGIRHVIPHAGQAPASEAVDAARGGAVALRQVAPGCTGAQYPEDTVQYPPVVDPGHAVRLDHQQELDHAPFEIGRIIATHYKLPQFAGLNHRLPAKGITLMSTGPNGRT